MKTALFRYLKRLTISASLKTAFMLGAGLTLIVSGVSLYSWHEQSSQVRYALNDYLPQIESSFTIESNLGNLVDRLNEFLQAANTSTRLQLRNQIEQHLAQIEHLSQKMDSSERASIQSTLTESRTLLARLDNALYTMFIAREKTNEIAARINWLHDDFTTELNSLLQDFSWQQSALLDQMENRGSDTDQRIRRSLRAVQSEQQQVYALSRLEDQITDDLRDRLNALQTDGEGSGDIEAHLRYLHYLKRIADENLRALDAHPSTVTLRQTIEELLDIGMAENKMPAAIRDYVQAKETLKQVTQAKEATLARFRTQLETQLGNSHRQLQRFNQRLEHIMWVSGGLILFATLLALLLTYLLNHYFIRSRLVKRFTLLNKAVTRIGLGETGTKIPVYGVDELGRIARLLRRTLGQLNRQKHQLELEIAERKDIEHHLRTTQDELVQAAKLAVVGQTMTTLAHEINQPLNALSMYLFTARNNMQNGEPEAAQVTLAKADGLIARIDAIIRTLRSFTRRAEVNIPAQPVPLRQVFTSAWELLSLRHRPQKGKLFLPAGDPIVTGDDVRLQQVFVNLLTNALDSRQSEPHITVFWQEQHNGWQVMIEDNGSGWPMALADSLLKPFTTNKPVGLGIGLSISVSLMEQMGGSLNLASTLKRGACIVLSFKNGTPDAD